MASDGSGGVAGYPADLMEFRFGVGYVMEFGFRGSLQGRSSSGVLGDPLESLRLAGDFYLSDLGTWFWEGERLRFSRSAAMTSTGKGVRSAMRTSRAAAVQNVRPVMQ